MARRPSKMHVSGDAKYKAIIGQIQPLALHGSEVANSTEKALKHLVTTIMECIMGAGTRADLDLAFQLVPEKKVDMDPVGRILLHRAMALRRAVIEEA